MNCAEENKVKLVTKPIGKHPFHFPPSVIHFLTTRCLVAALVLQVLGVFYVSSRLGDFLVLMGLMLAVIGLGAYAGVKSGDVEGWAFVGLIPIFGLLIGYGVLRSRTSVPDAPLNAVRGAVHAALIGLILIATSVVLMNSTQVGHEIGVKVPNTFPILAVVPDDDGANYTAYIVQKRQFEKFAQEHPDISYLVPKHFEAFLHKNLRYYDRSNDFLPFESPGYFKVTRLSADRQSFEVRYPIHSEAYSVGWYEATAQGVEPKHHFFFDEMTSGFLGMVILGITLTIYPPLAWLLNRTLWPRWRTETSETPNSGATELKPLGVKSEHNENPYQTNWL